MSTSFDLKQAFAAKQKHMLSGLGLMPTFTSHPTAKGDATEEHWIRMLSDFLPRRYGVGSVFAIDSYGKQSQQIDVAVYDRQYSPLFFQQGELTFVPVESIYAIFEAKPELSKDYVDYAREKIGSVRKLHRTSVGIRHAGELTHLKSQRTNPFWEACLPLRHPGQTSKEKPLASPSSREAKQTGWTWQ
ncbi:DUF6602 domain-containing protein [Arthrobacter sp. ISL-95]|uniref:DUF6602 domain-containing protein n=1 Tax=Arthrobacter sp. ISL-95 TaxID=2819116 RepID=UPI001BE9D813|nr:DUF6602 domain-containing protein [Arthrobacter sp. ISL-95]MBT2588489.1 hypothetical protein [Arthrobacter sp. ISL-95]